MSKGRYTPTRPDASFYVVCDYVPAWEKVIAAIVGAILGIVVSIAVHNGR